MMHLFTKITIALVLIAALFDFGTTAYLLHIGSVQIGEITVVFYEKNILYNLLGLTPEQFMLLCMGSTFLVAYALFRFDIICLEYKSYNVLIVGCSAVIAIFVIPHIILGYSNLQLIRQFILIG